MTVADYAQQFKINPACFLQLLAAAGIVAKDAKDELTLTIGQKLQLTQLMNNKNGDGSTVAKSAVKSSSNNRTSQERNKNATGENDKKSRGGWGRGGSKNTEEMPTPLEIAKQLADEVHAKALQDKSAEKEQDELTQLQLTTLMNNPPILTDHDKTKERDNGTSPAHILSPLHIAKKIIHQPPFTPRDDAPESEPNIKMSVAQYAQLFKISPQHFLHRLASAGIPVQNTQDFLTLTCVKKNVAQPVNPPHCRSEKKDNEETEL